MSEMMKIYSSGDTCKYSGECYEYLDDKFAIFEDNCMKIGLLSEMIKKVFSIMLHGWVLTYYYRSIQSNSDIILEKVLLMVRSQFETYEVR